jgi:hypothetical protein
LTPHPECPCWGVKLRFRRKHPLPQRDLQARDHGLLGVRRLAATLHCGTQRNSPSPPDSGAAACPHLDATATHVGTFAEMLTGRHGDRLDSWMASVGADDLPHLHRFVTGLKRDYQAVRNGPTLSRSSGTVEGNVNRIKMIKRQMYGRGNFDLFRKRICSPRDDRVSDDSLTMITCEPRVLLGRCGQERRSAVDDGRALLTVVDPFARGTVINQDLPGRSGHAGPIS